jgi:class 3 adenylate cyclase
MPDAEPSQRSERFELPLLIAAGISVVVYALELHAELHGYLVPGGFAVVGAVLDVVFVVDLVTRVVRALRVRGDDYLTSPWFPIDLFSALPALAWWFLPESSHALRLIRGLRMLRTLRAARALPALARLPGMSHAAAAAIILPAPRLWHTVTSWLGVLFYAALAVVMNQLILEPDEASEAQRKMLHASSELAFVLGSCGALALAMLVARRDIPRQSLRQVAQVLSVALPGQVARHLLRHPADYTRSVKAPVSVAFSDIAGFTTAVESLGDDLQTFRVELEKALEAIVSAQLKQDVIIDKFIGDAVMAFRGGEHVEGDATDHARRVVLGTLQGAAALKAIQSPWFTKVKSGIASGQSLLVGTFGARQRLSYTVLGDRVNLAARLEASCKQLGAETLCCEQTRALCDGMVGVVFRKVGAVRVQGKKECVWVHEAFLTSSAPPWLDAFNAAVDRYEARDFAGAAAAFADLKGAQDTDDVLTGLFLAACARYTDEPPPADWAPVLETTK